MSNFALFRNKHGIDAEVCQVMKIMTEGRVTALNGDVSAFDTSTFDELLPGNADVSGLSDKL